MLAEEKIKWGAHLNSQYEHEGSYISFHKDDFVVKMDFSGGKSYRYEYTGKRGGGNYGRSVFGDWPKEDFVVFIYTELIQKINKPMPCQP
jgi:hypothetical protein